MLEPTTARWHARCTSTVGPCACGAIVGSPSPPKLAQAEAEGLSDKALTTMLVEALTAHPRAGTPATLTAEQIVQMVAVACEDPTDSGRPVSHWTPREVAEEVRKRGMVETISTRSVGRFLQSG